MPARSAIFQQLRGLEESLFHTLGQRNIAAVDDGNHAHSFL